MRAGQFSAAGDVGTETSYKIGSPSLSFQKRALVTKAPKGHRTDEGEPARHEQPRPAAGAIVGRYPYTNEEPAEPELGCIHVAAVPSGEFGKQAVAALVGVGVNPRSVK